MSHLWISAGSDTKLRAAELHLGRLRCSAHATAIKLLQDKYATSTELHSEVVDLKALQDGRRRGAGRAARRAARWRGQARGRDPRQ